MAAKEDVQDRLYDYLKWCCYMGDMDELEELLRDAMGEIKHLRGLVKELEDARHSETALGGNE